MDGRSNGVVDCWSIGALELCNFHYSIDPLIQ